MAMKRNKYLYDIDCVDKLLLNATIQKRLNNNGTSYFNVFNRIKILSHGGLLHFAFGVGHRCVCERPLGTGKRPPQIEGFWGGFFIYCFSLGTLIKTVKCFVTRLTTELLETSSLRIIDVQLLGERWKHSIVLFCFRFLSPIMTFFNRYFPSVMVNPLWDPFRRYISLKYSV